MFNKNVFCLVIFMAGISASARELNSLSEFREEFIRLHAKGDIDSARKLFCPGKTAQRITDMYNASLENAFSLKIESAEIQDIPSDRQPTVQHIVKPEKRLFLTFSKIGQSGVVVQSSFFYIGQEAKSYCLSIPKL